MGLNRHSQVPTHLHEPRDAAEAQPPRRQPQRPAAHRPAILRNLVDFVQRGVEDRGALVDVHKTFAGDATRGILGLADAPAAARGGFEAVKLKAQRKAAGAYTVRVGAAWACAPARTV